MDVQVSDWQRTARASAAEATAKSVRQQPGISAPLHHLSLPLALRGCCQVLPWTDPADLQPERVALGQPRPPWLLRSSCCCTCYRGPPRRQWEPPWAAWLSTLLSPAAPQRAATSLSACHTMTRRSRCDRRAALSTRAPQPTPHLAAAAACQRCSKPARCLTQCPAAEHVRQPAGAGAGVCQAAATRGLDRCGTPDHAQPPRRRVQPQVRCRACSTCCRCRCFLLRLVCATSSLPEPRRVHPSHTPPPLRSSLQRGTGGAGARQPLAVGRAGGRRAGGRGGRRLLHCCQRFASAAAWPASSVARGSARTRPRLTPPAPLRAAPCLLSAGPRAAAASA